jgi:hypothetical protein
MLCKGMHPQIQNNRYENNTLYLKECIHKYKTTGNKEHEITTARKKKTNSQMSMNNSLRG